MSVEAALRIKDREEAEDERRFQDWKSNALREAWETVRSHKDLAQHLDSDMMAYHLSRIFSALTWVKPADTDSTALQDLIAELQLFEREMRRYVAGIE